MCISTHQNPSRLKLGTKWKIRNHFVQKRNFTNDVMQNVPFCHDSSRLGGSVYDREYQSLRSFGVNDLASKLLKCTIISIWSYTLRLTILWNSGFLNVKSFRYICFMKINTVCYWYGQSEHIIGLWKGNFSLIAGA